MEIVEGINLLLDFTLILASLWMVAVARSTLGGIIGKSFSFITWGVIVLGIAHIAETVTFGVFRWDVDVVEMAHRLIVLAGFVLLILGFREIKRIKT